MGEEEARKPVRPRLSPELDAPIPIPIVSAGSGGGYRPAVSTEHRAGKLPYLFSTVLLQAVEEMTSIGKPKGQHLKIF